MTGSLDGLGLVKTRLNQLSRRPVFLGLVASSLFRRPMLTASWVSGVPCSLSAAGVLGVSPPELKS
jgi:hypothetical protein